MAEMCTQPLNMNGIVYFRNSLVLESMCRIRTTRNYLSCATISRVQLILNAYKTNIKLEGQKDNNSGFSIEQTREIGFLGGKKSCFI